ncbi:MAG: ATP-dependent zinc metalloprotease FtsH [Patescibacteria group bacterium]
MPEKNSPKSLYRNIIAAFLILISIAALYSFIKESFKKTEEIPLSQLVAEINAGNVTSIKVSDQDLVIIFNDDSTKISRKETEASFTQTLDDYGVSQDQLKKIKLEIVNPSGFMVWILNLLPFLIPFFLIVIFFWITARQVKSTSMQAFSFGKSRARVIGPEDQKERVTFKNVAGVHEAKEELMEIVEFLKNPKKFLDMGARIPKGVLLMGPPGTGKTLLARAVAGEAGVPFFIISGSEFVELFVGVGASRVRDLFKMAKRAAPAIVFIDEIDAVGRQRGAGLGGGHDEREQTLNQILVEMDGFEPHEKVIVMAATNRPDVLDPALLRPGRFDRRVILDLPDIEGREEILNIHAKMKPLDNDINLRIIAERTPGFSGADLQNLMNEGAILAARAGRKKISQNDLIRSIEKVMLGPERKSHLLTKDEKKIASYHEAGHALVASVLPNADPVHKVSVVSRGRAAGYTLKLPLEERHLFSKSHFLDEIAVALGGYAAEKIIFNDITTGAADDLYRATEMARDLITRYGMSEKIGPVAYEGREGMVFLGRDFYTERNYSEEMAKEIDKEVKKIMYNALKRAGAVFLKYRPTLEKVAMELIEKETLERSEFEKIITEAGIKLKKEYQHT